MATVGTITLSQYRTKLARLIGKDEDTLTTANKDALTQYLQDAMRDVYLFHRWDFLREYYRVRLYACYDAGSVAVAAAGTAWTGTSTSWDTTWTGGVIKIRASDEIYRVTSIDSTTALTSTDAAIVALSEEDYALYMDEVDLSSAVENIEACFVAPLGARLRPMAAAVMADHKSRGFMSGHPQYFSASGRNSSGYARIELYPIPAYDEVLHVHAYKAGTIPTADSGTCDVPDRFQSVVLARAKMYLHESPMGKEGMYPIAGKEYYRMQALMVQQSSLNQGPQRIALDPAVHGPEPIDHDVTNASVV